MNATCRDDEWGFDQAMSAPVAGSVLVTGGSGYLGAALIRRLERAGLDVHATSRTAHARGGETTWWEVDLTDEGATAQVVNAVRPTVIWHLAGLAVGQTDARLTVPMFQVNALGTVHLLSAAYAAEVPRVVIAGSMQQVRQSGEVPTPYSASKSAAEAAARLFAELYEMSIVVLRIGMVYGPGEREEEMLVPYVINSLLRGEHPSITDPSRSIDWIYIDDVVDALVAASHNRKVSRLHLEIGSGVTTPIRDVVRSLYRLLSVDYEEGKRESQCTLETYGRAADIGAAAECIGWRPRTQLDAGLQQTVDWWKSRLMPSPRQGKMDRDRTQ